MPGEESIGRKKRHQREKRRGGAAPCFIRWLLLSSTASTDTLLYYTLLCSAGSHVTVPMFDLFTVFTGTDGHRVLLVPHR